MPLFKTGTYGSGRARSKTNEALPVSQVCDIPDKFQKKYGENVMEVGVACKVISISDIDMANGTFSADFNLNVAWKGKVEDKPDVQFYNKCDDTELDEADPKKAPEGKGFDWFYRVRCRNTFRQVYKLQEFPFDQQDLTIDVRLKKECKLVKLAWGPDGEASSCDPRCLNDEFSLVSAKVEATYLPSYKFGDLAGYDPEATLIFTVARKPMFWVINYGVASSLICSLIFLHFPIPPESIDARLGVAMTLVLTMSATKYLMMDKLPSVTYFTLLDYHIVICCAFLLLLTMEIGLAAILGPTILFWLEICLVIPGALAAWIGYHVYVYKMIYL